MAFAIVSAIVIAYIDEICRANPIWSSPVGGKSYLSMGVFGTAIAALGVTGCRRITASTGLQRSNAIGLGTNAMSIDCTAWDGAFWFSGNANCDFQISSDESCGSLAEKSSAFRILSLRFHAPLKSCIRTGAFQIPSYSENRRTHYAAAAHTEAEVAKGTDHFAVAASSTPVCTNSQYDRCRCGCLETIPTGTTP